MGYVDGVVDSHSVDISHQVAHTGADQEQRADAAMNDDVLTERNRVTGDEKEDQQNEDHQAEHDAAVDQVVVKDDGHFRRRLVKRRQNADDGDTSGNGNSYENHPPS